MRYVPISQKHDVHLNEIEFYLIEIRRYLVDFSKILNDYFAILAEYFKIVGPLSISSTMNYAFMLEFTKNFSFFILHSSLTRSPLVPHFLLKRPPTGRFRMRGFSKNPLITPSLPPLCAVNSYYHRNASMNDF